MSSKKRTREEDTLERNDAPAKAKRKLKMDVARSISIQPVASSSSAPIAGPSTTVQQKALPGALDVEKFTEARSFEIKAMQDAMVNARAGSTHRVWQTLPRHLRRRAASHDVRRVPARLREKAIAEMDSNGKPGKKKKKTPKRGKEKVVSRADAFLKRQKDKTWLETHIWHAKRMIMENMWGYRLAVHPTEKAFRPSHRASIFGSILHDASYEAIIELSGPETKLKQILALCCDPQGAGPASVRYVNGSRVLDTHIYHSEAYPFGLIAPVTIIWRPVETAKTTQPESTTTSNVPKAKDKGKNKSQQGHDSRQVWVKCHPLCFEEVRSALQLSTSMVLAPAPGKDNAAKGSKDYAEILISDLRDQFVVFELFGPKCCQVLSGALKPAPRDKGDFEQLWKAFGQIQTSGSIPRGVIIGCRVYDPRLDFPPKNVKVNYEAGAKPSTTVLSSSDLNTTFWPTAKLAQSEIWDEKTRERLSKPKFKKKHIDERKSKHLIPDTGLKPLRQDNRIPLMLIQRSLESPLDVVSHSGTIASASLSRPIHGWTLTAPKGWGMPLLSSLTHTGTRVGGQRERERQRREAGCVYFPRDYVGTRGYEKWMEGVAKEEKETWERKPPAKRVNWEKVGTECPWKADWEGVLGLREVEGGDAKGGMGGDNSALLSTQREGDEGVDVDKPDPPGDQPNSDNVHKSIWILRGPETLSIIEALVKSGNSPAETLYAKTTSLRRKMALAASIKYKPFTGEFDPNIDANALYERALVMVRVRVPRSGSPEDLAVLYTMDDGEATKWRDAVGGGVGRSVDLNELRMKGVGPGDKIIGFVTTGHYSLNEGKGAGLGAVSLARYLELCKQVNAFGHGALPMVKFRNKHVLHCELAYLEVLP